MYESLEQLKNETKEQLEYTLSVMHYLEPKETYVACYGVHTPSEDEYAEFKRFKRDVKTALSLKSIECK